MLHARQQAFEGPLPVTQINGQSGEVYRYGYGLIWSGNDQEGREFPYTVYILEDTTALGRQVAAFRSALWLNLGGAGLVLGAVALVIAIAGRRPRATTKES